MDIIDILMAKMLSGGGLPDASDYADGTALIAKDGAFVPSTGYGYLMPDTIVTWDGCYRESRDLIFDAGGEYYYISPLSDVIPPSVDLVGLVEREFGGESETVTQSIVFGGEAAGSYKMWAAPSFFTLYGVLSDSFWNLFGMPSLGTGLFMLMPLPSGTFDDGACVVPKSTQSDVVYYDSFHLDLTIPGASQAIDRKLLGGLVYVVNVDSDGKCDKTAKEIEKAFENGPVQFVQIGSGSRSKYRSNLLHVKAPINNSSEIYAFYVWFDWAAPPDAGNPGTVKIYTASTKDAYPERVSASESAPVI